MKIAPDIYLAGRIWANGTVKKKNLLFAAFAFWPYFSNGKWIKSDDRDN